MGTFNSFPIKSSILGDNGLPDPTFAQLDLLCTRPVSAVPIVHGVQSIHPQPYGRSARRRICHLTPVSLCSCYGAAPTRCRNGPGPRKLNGHGTGSASDTGARSGQGATAESPTYSSEGISDSNSSHSPESSSLRRVCRRSSYVEAALYAQAAPMWREA